MIERRVDKVKKTKKLKLKKTKKGKKCQTKAAAEGNSLHLPLLCLCLSYFDFRMLMTSTALL